MPARTSNKTTIRPVWRSFRPEYLRRAAAHVRAGGFAAIFQPNGQIKVLLPRERDGQMTEMATWALLSLDIRRWGAARTGPARHLAAVRVKDEHRDIIREWCDRDAEQPASTRRVSLDCLACGACCRDNNVVLEKPDLARWRRAQREDLLGPTYVRRSNGKVVLKLRRDDHLNGQRSKSCVHLGAANRCAIYALRPDNCSAFPKGSEACLAARLDTLGIVD